MIIEDYNADSAVSLRDLCHLYENSKKTHTKNFLVDITKIVLKEKSDFFLEKWLSFMEVSMREFFDASLLKLVRGEEKDKKFIDLCLDQFDVFLASLECMEMNRPAVPWDPVFFHALVRLFMMMKALKESIDEEKYEILKEKLKFFLAWFHEYDKSEKDVADLYRKLFIFSEYAVQANEKVKCEEKLSITTIVNQFLKDFYRYGEILKEEKTDISFQVITSYLSKLFLKVKKFEKCPSDFSLQQIIFEELQHIESLLIAYKGSHFRLLLKDYKDLWVNMEMTIRKNKENFGG